MASRCLITGAQGFIGRYLTALILRGDADARVVGLGRSPRLDGFFSHHVTRNGQQHRAALAPEIAADFDGRFGYAQLSLSDARGLGAIIRWFKPDCVFHLASGLSSSSEEELRQSNIDATASLMDAVAAQAEPKPSVVLASSGAVYGPSASLPHSESDRTDPADFYGVMKLAAEHIVRVKATRARARFFSARIYNVVGPGQAEAHVCGRFAAELVKLRVGPSTVLKVQNWDTTRDFIDVRDVAAALLMIAQRGDSGAAYNVATGRETAIRDILRYLIHVAGCTGLRIESAGGRRFDVLRHFADISSLRRLGFAPRYTLQESLKDVLAYYGRSSSPGTELPHHIG